LQRRIEGLVDEADKIADSEPDMRPLRPDGTVAKFENTDDRPVTNGQSAVPLPRRQKLGAL
jgi:hypothetical protein